MEHGNIIFLNGTSSAGKSTIAKALQEIMEEPYIHTGIDHFLERVPSRFFVHSDGTNPPTAEGWLLVFRDGTVQSFVAEAGRPGFTGATLAEIRIGPTGHRLLAGMYQGIAALAAAGLDLIVDDVIYDWRVLNAAVDALHTLPVLFVGLHCPREVVARRERERGDRGPGGALAFYDLVHQHGIYDLELDTSEASPAECAARIKAVLHGGLPCGAFARLAQQKEDT